MGEDGMNLKALKVKAGLKTKRDIYRMKIQNHKQYCPELYIVKYNLVESIFIISNSFNLITKKYIKLISFSYRSSIELINFKPN